MWCFWRKPTPAPKPVQTQWYCPACGGPARQVHSLKLAVQCVSPACGRAYTLRIAYIIKPGDRIPKLGTMEPA